MQQHSEEKNVGIFVLKNKINFIFDTETNGLHNCSVLSISFIISKEDKILNKQTRYYFPKENYYNKHAIAVNGLKKEIIEKHREDISYPLYFVTIQHPVKNNRFFFKFGSK